MIIIEIIIWIVLYCTMWIVTSIALAKWSKNPDPEWVGVGMLWPLVIASIPIVAFILFASKIVEKYGK